MSSVVYYKFKSQKEPSRVNFDGTGISVFDLKREILVANKLTSTAESFDLILINPDTKEEYKDDTEVVPRSISVGARRIPSGYPGASRYVTGAASMKRRREVRPVVESSTNSGSGNAGSSAPAGSEEEQIASMLASQTQQWEQAQEHMSQQQFISTRNNANNANVPDHPPPPGYICYRCGQKGHWIQACPTNNDPNWEGKRVKRTTGIPKSMLKTVQRPADDDQNTYMVNEDGEYVVAVADNKSWQQFKDKTQAAQNANSNNSKPIDPELECPLSHKLFADPVKTPCCSTTYSREPIETYLFEHDFHCPNCDREELLLDQLVPDKEMKKRVEEYRKSESTTKRKRESDDEAEEGDEKKLKGDENTDSTVNANGEDAAEGKGENVETTNPQNMPMMPGMPMPPWMMMMPPPPMMMPPFMPPFMPQNQNQNQNQNQRR